MATDLLDLIDEAERELSRGRSEQAENLDRVSAAIAGHVRDFCRARLALHPPRFYMSELTEFVSSRVSTAPDSAGRILRDLRRRKVVDYKVVSRSESLYEVVEA